jgi:hypothetical protein
MASSWLSEPVDAWLSTRPCVDGLASNCGDYPTLLFLGTCVAAVVSFRGSVFHKAGSALNLALSHPLAYYLFGFCGSSCANLFLGRGIASIVPATKLQLLCVHCVGCHGCMPALSEACRLLLRLEAVACVVVPLGFWDGLGLVVVHRANGDDDDSTQKCGDETGIHSPSVICCCLDAVVR